jgi:hypothetical protein
LARKRAISSLYCQKWNFWLNPRSECQKPLRAEEIALIMNRKIFDIDFAGAAKPSN